MIITMMKKKILFLLLSPALLLTSCGGNETSTIFSNSSGYLTSLPSDYNASVKNYLKALKAVRNYSIAEVVSSSQTSAINFIQISYTENAFYYSFGENSYGYIAAKEGVYGVSLKHDELIGSELLFDEKNKPYQSFWNSDLVTSFASFDDEQINSLEDGVKADIKGKKNKVALLSMLGLGTNYYASINKLTGSITKSGKLLITLSVSNASAGTITIEATVDSLLETTIPEINDYLSSGGTYYTVDEDLSKARTIMRNNNYTHYYYEGNRKVGTEYFHQDYYFVNWDSAYVASSGQILLSQGLIGIDHKKDPNNGALLNGSYLVSMNGNTLQISLSAPYNNDPDIPSVYHYPSFLSLWDDLQYFEEDVIPSDMDASYVTDDAFIMNDFVTNFSLENSTANVTLTKLHMGFADIDNKQNKQTIRFELETSGGTLSYDFVNFGSTNIPAFDQFLSSLVDQ